VSAYARESSIGLPMPRRSRGHRSGEEIHPPALLELGEKRARSVQNRVADTITRFAGSMWFAYLHIAWFAIWIALGVESFPYRFAHDDRPLEAIFLSTFVMISQNRQDDAPRAPGRTRTGGWCSPRNGRTGS
jgi:hypothetical protein